MARKTTKKARIFSLLWIPEIPGKEGKNAQKSKEFLAREKSKETQKSKEKKIRESCCPLKRPQTKPPPTRYSVQKRRKPQICPKFVPMIVFQGFPRRGTEICPKVVVFQNFWHLFDKFRSPDGTILDKFWVWVQGGGSWISKISKFSRISRKWSDSPLFSTVWGFSRISGVSRFSRISRHMNFSERTPFPKRPLLRNLRKGGYRKGGFATTCLCHAFSLIKEQEIAKLSLVVP